jgi:type IV pilus assembly protein PilY1
MIMQGIKKYFLIVVTSLFIVSNAHATVAQDPLFLVTSVDPNVLFNMSVETPMGGAAYNDQPDGGSCAGRPQVDGHNDGNVNDTVGICYFNNQEYLGYFDPNKCYTYGSNRFNPVGPTNALHECSGQYSGNFMNWASMTAMDMFVWTMTGGNRVIDTAGAGATTVVRRTRKQNNNSWFPRKLISAAHNVAPSTVTPWADSEIYIHNNSFGIKFGTSFNGNEKGTFDSQVRLCDQSIGLEENCVPYDSGAYYKPEGLVQENADSMRFAVTSYSNTSGNGIDGGVLRSNMKYIGANMPDGSGNTIANPNAEILPDGTLELNSNSADATASGVSQSGVIPYLNKFSDAGYKGNDPASELFYESLRYFKGLTPTAEYLTGNNGGFPIIQGSGWEDPIQHWCQSNFIVGMNDANPWKDKKLPGTFFTSNTFNGEDISDDFGEPSTPDGDINITALTNKVGDLEGLNGTDQCIGCTGSDCDGAKTAKTIDGLGQVFGTCPGPGKENSYYIAGLAYYANTEDIRTDLQDKQTVSTFMIDSQEYNDHPLIGPMNMLWLAGKYGGFIDENDDGDPNDGTKPSHANYVQASQTHPLSTTSTSTLEWDSDGDHEPDNYVLATEPAKLVASLNAAFDDIVSRTSSATSVATNSTRLDTNTKIYQARFNSGDWTGNILAFDVDDVDGTIGNQAWDAASLVPAENSRNIFSYDPTAVGDKGIVFEYANLNTSQMAFLDQDHTNVVDSLGSDRADHIRGDTSNEQQNSGGFRDRASVFGDVINSDPWFVGRIEDFGYSSLAGTEGSSYITHRQDKLSRTPALYFGANDGMLHAINAETGTELFTYVPDTVISSLNQLTTPFYGCDGAGCIPHAYFVDGAPRVADAYVDLGSGDDWASILIGTLGAGGKGFFAMNVTDPDSFTATDILWENSITQAATAGDLTNFQNHLGYTISQGAIVRFHNGKWGAIISNGYESASHKAVLFIIDIETGEIMEMFDSGVGSIGSPNGMSTAIPIDSDGDRIVDSIYAGDLQGNLWKIDVTATNSNSWDFAFKQGSTPEPLFIATDASNVVQPITAKPQVGEHPDGGLMVYFGTGKYYANNDQVVGPTPQVQTFYGIRDQNATVVSRADMSFSLQEQEIIFEESPSSINPDFDIRVTSNTAVNYPTAEGWYMDLVSPVNGAEGERVVSAPLLRGGRVIFSTLIPEADPCGFGGSSWLMELDAVSGRRLETSPFDVNEDGVFDITDYLATFDTDGDGDVDADDKVIVSGLRNRDIGITKTPGVVTTGGGTEVKYVSGSSGQLEVYFESAGDPIGRQSWRQLR